MKNYWVMLFILVTTLSVQAGERLIGLNDPFAAPPLVSCAELESQLLAQLNTWQYQGYMQFSHDDHQATAIIWLTNYHQWLQVTDFITPESLLPWQITAFSTKQINWTSTLPKYCDKQLMITMAFKGK